MPQTVECTPSEEHAVEEILHRVTSNLSILIDLPILIEDVEMARWAMRPAGATEVHISFKLRFSRAGEHSWGCLLLPLPEALTLAGYLMMMPADRVEALRSATTLGRAEKDSLLEIAGFVGSAVDTALQDGPAQGWSVCSDGCQGVRADVRPAFPYDEGAPLIVARALTQIDQYPVFDALLVLPDLGIQT